MGYSIILKLSCRSIAFTSYEASLKNKKRSGSSLLASFFAWFLKKEFRLIYFIYWPNLIAWLPFLREILGNMCIVIVCKPGCDVIHFEISLIFLIKPLLYMNKESRQKLKYLENEKSFRDEIKIIFHHFKRVFIESNKKLFF